MDLLIPDSGLLFWMTLVFIIVFIILWKAGFPAIIKMVNERKAFIDDSLKKAHEANEKLANIQNEGESILQEARLAVLHQEQNKKKPEEITQQEKDDVHNTEKAISDEKAKRNEIISGYAKNNNIVHQLIDLALLQNGMLKGASLDAFLKRSVDMIK